MHKIPSFRMCQLRELQAQLSDIIKDDRISDEDEIVCINGGSELADGNGDDGSLAYQPESARVMRKLSAVLKDESRQLLPPAIEEEGNEDVDEECNIEPKSELADDEKSGGCGRGGDVSVAKSSPTNLLVVGAALRRRLAAVRRSTADSLPPPRPRKEVSYDFLERADQKLDDNLQPTRTRGFLWWHGYFLFSLVALVACLVTLWAPYPVGARMTSKEVAETPWSSGCRRGLETCICPRETICADDLLSMVFLTIARCSAWFDYPLYMGLFLSKCDNLNGFMQVSCCMPSV